MSSGRGGFSCNVGAFSAEERVRYNELTKKLMGSRRETLELKNGFEFRFSAADVGLLEAAEWVTWESKCCPFFDFHIDLENAGRLLCLRLTGTDGVKQFIRAEFGLE